ncbi:MAG: hypothetical protein GF347_02185 [Candidatus Moranbacteria bacterium]|nr:hypothetical protein [Candidatus Moranbacteria bacterium]
MRNLKSFLLKRHKILIIGFFSFLGGILFFLGLILIGSLYFNIGCNGLGDIKEGEQASASEIEYLKEEIKLMKDRKIKSDLNYNK